MTLGNGLVVHLYIKELHSILFLKIIGIFSYLKEAFALDDLII